MGRMDATTIQNAPNERTLYRSNYICQYGNREGEWGDHAMTDKEMIDHLIKEAQGYLFDEIHCPRSVVAESKTRFCRVLDEARDYLKEPK